MNVRFLCRTSQKNESSSYSAMRSYPATGNFLQNIYSALVTLWLRIIRRSSEGF